MGNYGCITMGIVDIAKHTFEYSRELEKRRTFRNDYYTRLKKAKADFDSVSRSMLFSQWLQENYGIEVIRDNYDNITEEFVIVNESKHTLFLLKFS